MRAAFLSFVMLLAIIAGGAGIYGASATGDFEAVDGYGVTAAVR